MMDAIQGLKNDSLFRCLMDKAGSVPFTTQSLAIPHGIGIPPRSTVNHNLFHQKHFDLNLKSLWKDCIEDGANFEADSGYRQDGAAGDDHGDYANDGSGYKKVYNTELNDKSRGLFVGLDNIFGPIGEQILKNIQNKKWQRKVMIHNS